MQKQIFKFLTVKMWTGQLKNQFWLPDFKNVVFLSQLKIISNQHENETLLVSTLSRFALVIAFHFLGFTFHNFTRHKPHEMARHLFVRCEKTAI